MDVSPPIRICLFWILPFTAVAQVLYQGGWTEVVDETVEVALISGVRFGIHGNGGFRHHLLQHPDAAAGPNRKGDGITRACIHVMEDHVAFSRRVQWIGLSEFQDRMKGAVFDGMHDHAFQFETAGHQQSRHEVVAEGSRWFRPLQPGHDVVGLALVDPDRNLSASTGISQQHDRRPACRIQSNSGNAHLHHGGAAALSDYDQWEPIGRSAMFTGLVQAMGRIQRRGNGLLVEGAGPFGPLSLGDSVAVDGVCLTVAECVGEGFRADVSEETLERTTLGRKAERGGAVNLEPALRLSDRLGGHLVSGHIDAVGEVMDVVELPQSWRLGLRWSEPRFGRYVCEKASIAVDGISLTVASCSDDGVTFELAVIPHTWSVTTLSRLAVGDQVNLEADQLARYAERLLVADGQDNHHSTPAMSEAWLSENGWT